MTKRPDKAPSGCFGTKSARKPCTTLVAFKATRVDGTWFLACPKHANKLREMHDEHPSMFHALAWSPYILHEVHRVK